MHADFWQDKYPKDIARTLDPDRYRNIPELLRHSCERFAERPAFSCLGGVLSYRDLYRLSGDFAAWLQQHTDLQPGDRIAVQLPNLLQYPVVVFGALRAGLIVVNTNPLYTKREMEDQFQDAQIQALVCLNTLGHWVESLWPRSSIRYLILTELGDLLPTWRRWSVNWVMKYWKRKVPAYHLPQAVFLRDVLSLGRCGVVQDFDADGQCVAVLQYTGGTTGVAKGAMLTHRNLIANMLQCQAFLGADLVEGQEVMVAPLPLYHIYAFTLHCLVVASIGGHNLLIPDPRNLTGFVRTLKKHPFTGFIGLNTLFAALCHHEGFKALDFSHLKITFAGGMALQSATAQDWLALTGCPIAEGYGMTETSPVVSVNPPQAIQSGTIGLPLPSTLCKVIDGSGADIPLGSPEAGELCVQGPQVMKGYWQRPEETEQVLDAQGWIKTGDIAKIQADGYIRLVDRKKDLILVSGFNVYPNELEEVLSLLPEVLLGAAIGIPDARTGEAIKLFVVLKPGRVLTQEQVLQHMQTNLTGYKRPKFIEFRDRLPLSHVGKVLRRTLRDSELQRMSTS